MSDVAREAHVDTSVVSRVLSEDPALSIKPETRLRVLEAVSTLGYRPNALARGLRTRAANAIGLFVPTFANPIYAGMIEGASKAARELGLAIVSGAIGDTARSSSDYLRLLDESRVDGLLLATGASPEAVAELEKRRQPWLLLNRRGVTGRRYIILDDEAAARTGVEYLIQQGHQRIGHIGGPESADTASRRLAGYQSALEDAGLTVPDGAVAIASYTSAGGAEAMRQLLALREPPTGVFVANVTAAIGALSAASSAGIIVPDDMSIVALHDLPLADHTVPPLTTVRMPLEALGRRGIEILVEVDADERVEEVVSGPIELIERSSTGAPGR